MLADEEYINEYFRDALEGVLYNCKALSDYSAFERINQLLKKEVKFLPYRLDDRVKTLLPFLIID